MKTRLGVPRPGLGSRFGVQVSGPDLGTRFQVQVSGPGLGTRFEDQVWGPGLGTPPPPTHRLIAAASRSRPGGSGRGGSWEPPHPSSGITGSRKVIRIH